MKPSDLESTTSDFSIIPEMNVSEDDYSVPMSTSLTVSQIQAPSSLQQVKFVSVEPVKEQNVGAVSPLSVTFELNAGFNSRSSDRIALYPVGFQSSKDFLCYKWVPTSDGATAVSSSLSCFEELAEGDFEESKSLPVTVIFEANSLPTSSDSIYYQMCYLTKSGEIAGVSSPFKIENSQTISTDCEIDIVARKVLSLRVSELISENEKLKKAMEAAANCASGTGDHYSEDKELLCDNWLKEQELSKKEKEIQDLESRITSLQQRQCELNEKLEASENESAVLLERQSVLLRDNEELRRSLKALQHELETVKEEKVAAERVAVVFSEQLMQVGSSSADSLASSVNDKLTRKVKRLRTIVALLESECEFDAVVPSGTLPLPPDSSIETSSFVSQEPTEDICISLQRKMDEIVNQLSCQSASMRDIKEHIQDRYKRPVKSSIPAVDRSNLPTDCVAVHKAVSPRTPSTCSAESDGSGFYSDTFLPSIRTADVISVSNSASNPPSMEERSDLPPPLQPRATATALQAAVQYHLTNSPYDGASAPNARPSSGDRSSLFATYESDNANYHANREQLPEEISRPDVRESAVLQCPMCNLVFQERDLGLLEEHLNMSHLDRLCPICSLGFKRTTSQEEFEGHVQSHFVDDANTASPDSSPMSSLFSRFGLLDID